MRRAAVLLAGRMELTEDADLAQRLHKNDQTCLEEILRNFGGGILILLRRRFHDMLREEDLEDVLSIGLYRLWNNRARYRLELASLRVWLYRICENSARDVLRMGWQKARAREVISDAALLGLTEHAIDSPEELPEDYSLHDDSPVAVHGDLKELLGELPDVQHAILLADAAARDGVACSTRLGIELGIPASTVRVYRKRGMERWRKELIARGHGAMYAIDNLRALRNARSEQLLDQRPELPTTSQRPAIWRFASVVAEKAGGKRLAVERLQHAIQLAFSTRPTTINIEIVRADDATLLAKYDVLITAAITLEVAPTTKLAEKIVQATDQWRSLDQDDTAACHTAANLPGKLKQTELAWDYLTTPLAENSGESAPWIVLARSPGSDHQTTLASMAWNRAFEFKSTNPKILLEHAQMRIANGKSSTAKSLLQQIVTSEWQPRFSATIETARQLTP
jgi:RNA polymerase sigma factor (sigma-70 family)